MPYREYNYFVTYNEWGDRATPYIKRTALTIQDSKGDMVAYEIMDEIQERVAEIANWPKDKIEIIAVHILSQ